MVEASAAAKSWCGAALQGASTCIKNLPWHLHELVCEGWETKSRAERAATEMENGPFRLQLQFRFPILQKWEP